MMEKYCRLEQLRFGFRYSIEVDDCLDSESLQLPAMLIQPLVENAIRHGVQGLREAGFIRIVYAREGQDLVLSVSDNGPGLAYKATEGGTGTGLALTRLRIQYLQDLTGGPPIVFTLERLGSETVAKIRFTDWIEL
jgi:Putative regulator of cell autolysis